MSMEISPIENIKPGLRRSRATLLFSLGVPMVQPYGCSYGKASWVPENRFPPVRQTIPGRTDAISWYDYGDHSVNVSYNMRGF